MPKVLLVAEETAVAGLTERILDPRAGIRPDVEVADSLRSALAALATARFDAIVVDLALDEGAAPALLDALVAHAPGVPIISLGARGARHPPALTRQPYAGEYLDRESLESGSLARAIRHAVEFRQVMQALRGSEERYHRLLELSAEGIVLCSGVELVAVNNAAVTVLGASGPDQLLGRSITDFIETKDLAAVQQNTAGMTAAADPGARFLRRDMRRLDGATASVRVAGSACRHHEKPALQMVLHDVTELERLQSRLSYISLHDLVTALPNRNLCCERLDQALARASRNNRSLGLLSLGLDHFHAVNVSWGQGVGDQVLEQVARLVEECVRKSDSVARMGGDEFAVVLEDLPGKAEPTIVAKRILDALSQPVPIKGAEVRITASIGIAVFPHDAVERDALLRNADLTMYYAKECGGDNFQLYSPALDARVRLGRLQRAEIEHRIADLTAREREVLDMLVAGNASKMIAYVLGTSKRTIDNHRARVMEKMQAKSLAELVRMRLELGP